MIDFVLLGNSTRLALPVLQAMHSAGNFRCALVGSTQTAVLKWSHLCSQHAVIEFTQDDAAVRVLNRMAQQNPQAILIPFDCEAIRLVNRVEGRLGIKSIPVPNLATLNMFDDKWTFAQFCLDNDLPVPTTRFVGSKSNLDFSVIEAELGLPFIVKPINESGSYGVLVVHSREELEQKIVNNEAYQCRPLIAQKFIKGADMCINLLAVGGQLRAVSVHKSGTTFIEFVPHVELEAIAEKICFASGYNGVMNLDVRLETHTGRVFLIESNPRFWATLASTVACGLNFAAESVKCTESTYVPRRLSAGRFYARHPLLKPSSWWRLVSDPTESGRMLRARAFDLYGLGELVRHLLAMIGKNWQRVMVRKSSTTSAGTQA